MLAGEALEFFDDRVGAGEPTAEAVGGEEDYFLTEFGRVQLDGYSARIGENEFGDFGNLREWNRNLFALVGNIEPLVCVIDRDPL